MREESKNKNLMFVLCEHLFYNEKVELLSCKFPISP